MTPPAPNKPAPPARAYWPTESWRESTPGDPGIDQDRLDQASHFLAAHAPHMNSLLVVRHGWLVYEWVKSATTPDALHNLKSVTKSVTSLLTGIALHTGDLQNLDEPLGYIMPDAFTHGDDRHKRDITIRHLLTMRSGFAWEEYGSSAIAMTAAPDWVRFVLDRPLAHRPGVAFNYSTGDTQLLSAALSRLTGMDLLSYADLYLFEPLGITSRAWPADPQGNTIGGSELALAPRDMAKIGFLALNRGVWGGNQIVPPAWIAESHRQHSVIEPDDRGDCADLGYGYLWWLRQQGNVGSAMAVGFGGQFIYVIPALDIVVVLTGDIATAPESFRDNRMLCQFNLVEDFIVPAVMS